MKKTNKIVVTRHAGLVDYLKSIGMIDSDTPIVSHATLADIQGKDVIGNLPLRLASQASSVTDVALNLSADMRGKDLTIDDVRKIVISIDTYTVSKV